MTGEMNERAAALGRSIAHANTDQHRAALHNVLAWCKTVRLPPGFEAASDAVMALLEDGLSHQPTENDD